MKKITCDCSCADECPQGRRGMETRCSILVNDDKKETAMDFTDKHKIIYLEEIEWNALCLVYRVPVTTHYFIFRSDDKAIFAKKPKWMEAKPQSAEQYIKGYRDGMSAGKEYPMTAVIMGYSLEKIAELIAAHEKDNWEPKPDEALLKAQKAINDEVKAQCSDYNNPINKAPMTKPQALTKVSYALDYDSGTDKAVFNANGFVKALEALGLIEFVERETVKPTNDEYVFVPCSHTTTYYASILIEDAITALTNRGYDIKKDEPEKRKPSSEKGNVEKIEKPVEPSKSPSAVIAELYTDRSRLGASTKIGFMTADNIINSLYQAGYKISLR